MPAWPFGPLSNAKKYYLLNPRTGVFPLSKTLLWKLTMHNYIEVSINDWCIFDACLMGIMWNNHLL